jgi:ABC-type amino acid transport system permease subunit
VAVFFLLGALGYYSIPFIIQHLPSGVGPLILSLEFTTFSYVLGMGVAFGLGLVRAHPPRLEKRRSGAKRGRGRFSFLWRWPLYGFATGYVSVVRGTPFLVQMFIVLFAVTTLYPSFTILGWNQFYWCGLIALLINTIGYQAEVFRGGIQSVEAGQIEGAKAMGLTKTQTFFRVTLPQTFRLITLPLTNEWISNFKTAVILSYISIDEVYFWAKNDIGIAYSRYIEAFVMLTIFYLMVNVTLSRVVTYVEKVRRIPGLGTPLPEVSYTKRLLGTDRRSSRGGSVGPPSLQATPSATRAPAAGPESGPVSVGPTTTES